MSERFLSLKRVAFWPWFNGFATKWIVCIFLLLASFFAYDVYRSMHGGTWITIMPAPATYIGIGIVMLVEARIRELWARFCNAYPKRSRGLNALSLWPGWQIRVIATRGSAPKVLIDWCWSLYAFGGISYLIWQMDLIPLERFGILTVIAQVLTLGTGGILALIEWCVPGWLRI